MKQRILLLICFVAFLATTADIAMAQDVNMKRYIKLSVQMGQSLRFRLQAERDATKIKITNGTTEKILSVGTQWSLEEFDSSATELIIYGDLSGFDCGANYKKIVTLDLKGNPQLTFLSCYNNSLAALDISANTELLHLNCSNLGLRSLDISKHVKLSVLICSDNPFKLLDVSRNTELTRLDCDGNDLKSLDVSKNTKLSYLDCRRNLFSSEALNDLYCSLPDRNGKTPGKIYPLTDKQDKNADVVTASDAKNARNKKWEVQYYIGLEDIVSTGKYTCATALEENSITSLIYPNPVEDMLYVRSDEAVMSITVYDMQGIEVAAARSGQVELSHLPAGVYLLKLCTASHTKTVRVFKKKP